MREFSFRNESIVFLRGFGQVMLQQNALTGALFLLGICVNSLLMAAGGVLGSLAGVAAARVCRFNADEIAKGLYGFNGALVGIALLVFLEPGFGCFLLILSGGALSSLLMYAMQRWLKKVPAYTAPFIIVTWIMLLVGNALALAPAGAESVVAIADDLHAVLRGVGQVMFQESALAGLLFVAGLAVHSRQAAAWAVLGAVIGLLVARSLELPEALALAGIFGFNAVLTGIVLGDRYSGDVVLPLLGIVLSTLLLTVFQWLQIPALTAPFVLVCWVAVILVPPAAQRGRQGLV